VRQQGSSAEKNVKFNLHLVATKRHTINYIKVFTEAPSSTSIRETGKNPKNPLVRAKKPEKTQKKPKKPQKTQKTPLGWVFLKKTGFFPTLRRTSRSPT
jgi:hypothetical protein